MGKCSACVFVFVALSLFLESFGVNIAPAQSTKNHVCPKHEEYLSCGRPCQTECATLGKKCTIQNIKCPEGCYCKAGFARIAPGGRCIPQDKCPRPVCRKNEVWLECGQASACQRKCTELNVGCYIKPATCPEGCHCKHGYARHPNTNKCVKIEYCPKK